MTNSARDSEDRMTTQTHCSLEALLGFRSTALHGGSSVVARCPYCEQSDAGWRAADLMNGKRGMRPGPGVEYHCMPAYYCAS